MFHIIHELHVPFRRTSMVGNMKVQSLLELATSLVCKWSQESWHMASTALEGAGYVYTNYITSTSSLELEADIAYALRRCS